MPGTESAPQTTEDPAAEDPAAQDPAAQDPVQDRPLISERSMTIGLVSLTVAIAFESMAVATAMPAAAEDLNGLSLYGWAFSLFPIGMLFGTVVAGRLADRIGPAKPLIAGLLVFTVGLLVAAAAHSMPQLVGARLIQGLGSGVLNTAMFVCLAKVYPVRSRPRVITFISTAWVMPSFVGPPIAGWITHRLSWHWVFLAVIPLVALGLAFAGKTLVRLIRAHDDTPDPNARPALLWAAAVVAVGAASLQYAGQRLDGYSLIFLAAGLAGLLVGLPRLMPDKFMRLGRGLPAVVTARGMLAGAYFGAEAFIPLMLREQRDISLTLAGAVLTVGAVGWTTGSYLQSRPWFTLRRDLMISFGCVSVAIGIVLSAAVAFTPGLWFGLVAVGWIFGGLGMGLATASTSLAVIRLSSDAEQGRNASSLNLGDALGSNIFIAVSGTIFAALHPRGNLELAFGMLLIVMAFVAVGGAFASLRIGRVQSEFSQ